MRLLPLLLAAGISLAGCGGGGGTPTNVTFTLPSTGSLGGTVGSNGSVMLMNSTPVPVILVGEQNPAAGGQFGRRGFVSFDLGAIPAGATLLSATLTLFQAGVEAAPFASLGSILVDQVVYGNLLEAGAYARSFPSSQGFGSLSTDAALGLKSLVVTAQVQADRAALRTQSQFRLRFPIENNLDALTDLVQFWGTGISATADPSLVVTYQP